jgi:hypothetical protein
MLANQRKLYPLLFDCAAQTLLEFGRNRLQGDLGITAVLHTWGQQLDFHPPAKRKGSSGSRAAARRTVSSVTAWAFPMFARSASNCISGDSSTVTAWR